MAPLSWNGSQLLYNKVVRPIFLQHEATVDNMVSDLSGKAMDAAENLTREGNTPVQRSNSVSSTHLYLRTSSPQFCPHWWRISLWWVQHLSLSLKVYPAHLLKLKECLHKRVKIQGYVSVFSAWRCHLRTYSTAHINIYTCPHTKIIFVLINMANKHFLNTSLDGCSSRCALTLSAFPGLTSTR